MLREELRARKRLSPISKELEGVPLGRLSGPVYGFTYSPVNEFTPLFAEQSRQCFEIHKLAEGDVHIIGFVTPEEAETFLAGRLHMEVRLFPEPWEASGTLIELPLDRLLKASPLSRSDGNYMPVEIGAAI